MNFYLDSGIQNTKLEWIKLDNGTYRAFITLGTGDQLLEYSDGKNSHFEFIDEENLFNDDSLKSAYGMPITLFHPKSTTFNQNVDGQLVGSCLESFVRQDNKLLMPVTILDQRAIKMIDEIIADGNAYVEASPGYFLSDKKWQDDKKAYKQIDRRYDHIALLPVGYGRAGQEGVLRTDSSHPGLFFLNTDETYTRATETSEISTETTEFNDGTIVENTTIINTSYRSMTTYKVNNKEVVLEVTDGTIQEDSFVKLLESVNKDFAKLEGQKAALDLQLSEQSEKISLDAVSDLIAESIDLWNKVLPVFKADNADFQPDYTLKPAEIKQLYIKKFHPSVNLDSYKESVQLDSFIDGVWSAIAESIKPETKQDKVDRQLEQLKATANTDSKVDDYESRIQEAESKRQARIRANGIKD